MNNKLLAAALIATTTAVVAFYPDTESPANANTTLIKKQDKPKIQIAILLDTSSSMSGLINQTRNQLWQIVNEFSRTKRHGIKPDLEVAVYEYGNNALSPDQGYVRQVSELTGELDQVSEALFSLRTNGGNEFCGFAINNAVSELQWSRSDDDIKAIFIAGNEPFTQGPVTFQTAIQKAKSRGITVNTIHAGPMQTGINSGWKQGAMLAGGEYMNIDHNHCVVHIDAPQDKKLAELNKKLNQTYVPYGEAGKKKMQRQASQDARSQEISMGLLAKRAQSKASSLYNNSTWDLVDAIERDTLKVEELETAQLPAPMKGMSKDERKAYISKKTRERTEIQQEIRQLSKERNTYIKQKQSQQHKAGINTIDEAITNAIRKQAASKNYELDKKQGQ